MSEIPVITSMRPEPARDEYGRYLLPGPDSSVVRSWTRATTIAHTLDDEFHLTQWKRRMVLQGAASDPTLLDTVPSLSRQVAEVDDWRTAKEAREALNGLCDDAADAAGANKGSKLGTLLHTITEYDDAGRFAEIADQVPDDLLPDLRAYRRVMDAAGAQRPVEFIERIVVNPTVNSAGTFDRLLRLRDGRLVVGDLKTQQSVDFGWLSIAIQLAEYANADAIYDDETERFVPMPDDLDREVGVVMHLPVGHARCTLFEIDLLEGWEAAQLACQVRQFRSRSKALGWPYRAPGPSRLETPTGDQLTYLIRNASHPDALTALWRGTEPEAWTVAHTQAAAARKAQLVGTNP